MVSYYPDIFNDVFGPVMQPGSSSHTAGPVRIGYEAYCVLGEKPVDITVRLDSQGSFAGTSYICGQAGIRMLWNLCCGGKAGKRYL